MTNEQLFAEIKSLLKIKNQQIEKMIMEHNIHLLKALGARIDNLEKQINKE